MNRGIPVSLAVACLAAATWALAGSAAATSLTVELSNGAAYALDVRMMEPEPGVPVQPYVAFSGLAYVFRQFDERSRWDWDARTGLLRLVVGDRRFSFSSAQPVIVIDDRKRDVACSIRLSEGELWMPIDTLRLTIGSIEGIRLAGESHLAATRVGLTSASIVRTPEQALRNALMPERARPAVANAAATGVLLNIPPAEIGPPWKVVLDPVLVESAGAGPTGARIRAALVQLADRCANMLGEEGSMEPFVLTEHDEATTPDVILQLVAQRSADVVVFLRLEVSPYHSVPGYAVLYVDESIDWEGIDEPVDKSSSTATLVLSRIYLPFQAGNRRLAEAIGRALAEVPHLRQRLVLPAPLYLLRRCSARSVMLVLTFPENSPDLKLLADSGFRESVARALAGALIAYRRERRAPAAK